MAETRTSIARAVDELVDDYRERCLWFLRRDYYPVTPAEQLQVLRYIERHGDSTAYRKAAALKQWLSRNSSDRSAD